MKNTEMRYQNNTIRKILDSDSIVIYGAGTMGKAVLKCLTGGPYNKTVDCFIVKNLNDNSDMVDGVSVYEIIQSSRYKNSTVLIALNGKFIPEVIRDLTDAGFTDIIPISFDGDEWTALRGNWFEANTVIPSSIRYLSDIDFGDELNLASSNVDVKTEFLDRFHIYVAHSIYDRKLSEEPVDQAYEIPIQVGAVLTDKVMYDLRDSVGEYSISDKNRQYCELTGIYWAWKNDRSNYVGFSHYRRKFVLSEGQMFTIVSDDIDVVVTEPIVNFATVKGQYAKDHVVEDWDTFIRVIGELAPEYLESALKVQNDIYYYAYNMFIMKKEIFNEYCSFIFPILKRCEELIGTKEDVYQNRYVGFLAERLVSIFLTKHKKYKVAIADKHFIE